MKLSVACCFSNKVQAIEHYHNSSWLEHGGSPEKATRSAFVSAVDKYLREQGKYQKNESNIVEKKEDKPAPMAPGMGGMDGMM